MSFLCRELVFLILQFLDEEKYKETIHKLEKESAFYFNLKYFEEAVLAGNWEEVESYLSGFTKVDDNRYSMKIFFEIRKQKYLEALDRKDGAKAVDILVRDLKVFAAFNEDLFKEITQLLTLENFRENEQLSKYGDAKSARASMLTELKKLIDINPLFRDKLQFPNLKNSRLRGLINQSLNWQHQLCKNPMPNPNIKTLFHDHSCSQPNGARVASPAPPVMHVMPKQDGFPQLVPHPVGGVLMPFQPQATALPTSLAGWMANAVNATPMPHSAMSIGPLGHGILPNPAALLKRPATPTSNPRLEYLSTDPEHVLKRPRQMGISIEDLSTSHLTVAYAGVSRNQYNIDELPKNVAATLNQGSTATSMDFHPSQPTLLLVGTNVGDIAVWEVSCKESIAYKKFKVWELSACSTLFQSTLVKDPSIYVNRVLWSPDGSQFGVAYSQHLVHLYNFKGRDDLIYHLEIDAHTGGVNDIAFSQPNKKLCILTCGDDKTIKVWDAATGVVQYTFEGHEAPVYSICPHSKENIHFIFSTSIDRKIKAWLYDNVGSRVDYTAPGQWCTSMAYSDDGTRLFSCGSSKDGDSYIVEWNESEGSVKRTYSGFCKMSKGMVQFDTTKNQYLAAGDEFMIKFWDMDHSNLLTTTDAEGGLPASPRIRFNKLGSLLAVSTSDNCVKILANGEGFQLLRSLERLNSASRAVSDAKASTISPLGAVGAAQGNNAAAVDHGVLIATTVGLNGDNHTTAVVNPRVVDDLMEKSKIWKLVEINEPSQCSSLRLPDNLSTVKIARLIYTNSGHAILALVSNAVHKLWKWPKTDKNVSRKATVTVAPLMWQPTSGILMTNETSDVNPEEAFHCFALSKNESYVMSASGGKISLFNMMTFKTMTTFMPPPPTATFLAFHPQDNNIIAIGMDDSSIQIYNVRIDKVKSKLRGHEKRITGLAFSNVLNILISSGADAQLCIWGMDAWDKHVSKFLLIPPGWTSGPVAETKIEFHQDQVQFLVVHESHIAIHEAKKLECLKQWVPRDGLVSHATYACDSQMIYASFTDGSVSVFTSILQLRCRIGSTAYLYSPPSSNVYPIVVAAHPTEPNQFALGLTDGGVQVLEPLQSEGKWGIAPPPENVAGSNSSQPVGNPNSD